MFHENFDPFNYAFQPYEEYFRELIDNALDIISIIDVDGTMRYVSKAVETILGYKTEELVGHNAFEFVHVDDRASMISSFLNPDPNVTSPIYRPQSSIHSLSGAWRPARTNGRRQDRARYREMSRRGGGLRRANRGRRRG